ncbi:GTP 3',8-cyclase MoaA [Candidatus Latescibacterota bacterium]
MRNAQRANSQMSLRVSVTDQCQFNCLYCRPDENDSKCSRSDHLTVGEIMRFVNFLGRNYGLSKVHITGGEPLLRDDLHELIGQLAAEKIGDIALTTNGLRLYEKAEGLKRAGLKRINVSLDSLDPETTRVMTRNGDLSQTLAGIEKALECGFDTVKINTVVLRNVNDNEIADIAGFAMAHNCPVRFLELMPIGISNSLFREWYVSSTEVRERLSGMFELHEIAAKPGGSARNYIARDSKGGSGQIGFISPYSAPFCGDCSRLRLTSDGRIIGCLARPDNFEIRHFLSDKNPSGEILLKETVDSALNKKRSGRALAEKFGTVEKMVRIGG